MILAISFISFSPSHLVVIAGVHNLIQDGSNGGLLSNGNRFLLQDIQIFSNIFSAIFPDRLVSFPFF
jgi:hypothetical protein